MRLLGFRRLVFSFLSIATSVVLCCYSRASDIDELLSSDLSLNPTETGSPDTLDQSLDGGPLDSSVSSVIAELSNPATTPEATAAVNPIPVAEMSAVSPATIQTLPVGEGSHGGTQDRFGQHGNTCNNALKRAVGLSNNILNLSGVTDFPINGDATIRQYYQLLITTSSFGTHSTNIYIDLSKTGVTAANLAHWTRIFGADGKVLVLNLSYNESISDEVIDVLDLQKTYYLNFASTSVTDAGLAKIVNSIMANGIGCLVCINLTDSNVTENGIETLRAAMRKAAAETETKDGRRRVLSGTDGVIWNNNERHGGFPKEHRFRAEDTQSGSVDTRELLPLLGTNAPEGLSALAGSVPSGLTAAGDGTAPQPVSEILAEEIGNSANGGLAPTPPSGSTDVPGISGIDATIAELNSRTKDDRKTGRFGIDHRGGKRFPFHPEKKGLEGKENLEAEIDEILQSLGG
ncbi:MAG: hypothetical protein LBL32_00075 [Holosporales bacterium]|nr:hypothetical protein [Holosporales bacterium]